jgi:hypothetical protein
MNVFILLSIMSADIDWDNWNEKFMEKILRIVNSERIKHQRASKRVSAKETKSHYVFTSTISDVVAGSQQYGNTSNKFQLDKLRPGLSER